MNRDAREAEVFDFFDDDDLSRRVAIEWQDTGEITILDTRARFGLARSMVDPEAFLISSVNRAPYRWKSDRDYDPPTFSYRGEHQMLPIPGLLDIEFPPQGSMRGWLYRHRREKR